jgi:predicted nucleotidyltransferase
MSVDGVVTIQRWVGDSERWLKSFLRGVPRNDSIVAVIAMGSAVRERGHRRSDFDLLVIYRGTRPVIKAPLEVDIRYAPMEGIEDEIANGHEILCWALKLGAVLYDRTSIWNRLVSAWSNRIPLPSASVARKRALDSMRRAREMLEIGDDSAADDLLLAALTQFARERLVLGGVFPASRPELPLQLQGLDAEDALAQLLLKAMYGDSAPSELMSTLEKMKL